MGHLIHQVGTFDEPPWGTSVSVITAYAKRAPPREPRYKSSQPCATSKSEWVTRWLDLYLGSRGGARFAYAVMTLVSTRLRNVTTLPAGHTEPRHRNGQTQRIRRGDNETCSWRVLSDGTYQHN